MAFPHVQAGDAAPGYRKDPLRVACVQFDPKLSDVKGNTAKVLRMTSGIRPGSLDLLVLPEMCISGYMFTTSASIIPYLEPTPRIGRLTSFSKPPPPEPGQASGVVKSTEEKLVVEVGPTTELAQNLATRLKCHVIAGYPERGSWPSYPSPDTTLPTTPVTLLDVSNGQQLVFSPLSERVGWNSAVIVGPGGEVVGNYRKSSLYYTDINWAREGDGFKFFDLPPPLGRVCIGICMDMNPKDFLAPYDAYELANFVKNVGGDVLVVPMAWLNPPAEPSMDGPDDVPSSDPDTPEESTLNYWASRLTPLHDPSPVYGGTESSGASTRKEGAKEVVFVTCNRVGTEEGTTFVGTSCVMTIESEPKSRIELVEVAGRAEEVVLFATVN